MPDPPPDITVGTPSRPGVTWDELIFRRAAEQLGVVARRQLVGDRVPAHVIDHRLKSRRLRAIHRGVYRSGPVAVPHSREMAALLACGDRAVLSHRTAAKVWELVPPPRRREPIQITSPGAIRGPSEGVRLHRARRLNPEEIVSKSGLRITAPPRTLVDLAATGTLDELEKALARTERQGLVTFHELESLFVRQPHRPGNGALAGLLRLHGGPSFTRSEAEARFLSLLRRGELPRPSTNVMVEGLEVDFLWRRHRLVVEIDGYAYHRGRDAFERDRHRDAKLTANGLRVFRLTWRQLTDRPEALLVRLARALALEEPRTQQPSQRSSTMPQVS